MTFERARDLLSILVAAALLFLLVLLAIPGTFQGHGTGQSQALGAYQSTALPTLATITGFYFGGQDARRRPFTRVHLHLTWIIGVVATVLLFVGVFEAVQSPAPPGSGGLPWTCTFSVALIGSLLGFYFARQPTQKDDPAE